MKYELIKKIWTMDTFKFKCVGVFDIYEIFVWHVLKDLDKCLKTKKNLAWTFFGLICDARKIFIQYASDDSDKCSKTIYLLKHTLDIIGHIQITSKQYWSIMWCDFWKRIIEGVVKGIKFYYSIDR
jgi:hypothetical protein